MSTTIIALPPKPVTAAATTDQTLSELFIAMKRSPKTKEQYRHSTKMLLSFTGKPLQAITL